MQTFLGNPSQGHPLEAGSKGHMPAQSTSRRAQDRGSASHYRAGVPVLEACVAMLPRPLEGCRDSIVPKRGKMFAGITRQVVISDETHQLLRAAAQRENKYIGELADEILHRALTRQSGSPNVRDHREQLEKFAQCVGVYRRSTLVDMGKSRHCSGSPLFTPWTLKRRGDAQRLSQCLRATHGAKWSDVVLHQHCT